MTQQTQEVQNIQETVSAVLAETSAQTPPAGSPPAGNPPAGNPPAGSPPAPGPAKMAAKKRKAKKKVKRIIALVIVLALLAGGGFALWYFIFRNTVEQGELLDQPVQYGSIQNKAEGSGNAVAKDFVVITCPAGTIQEVFVSAGDTVMEGDPLYTVYSPTTEQNVKTAEQELAKAQYAVPDAEDHVADMQDALALAQEELAQTPQNNQENLDKAQQVLADAQEALAEQQKALSDLQASAGDLIVAAPFAGKLTSVESIKLGDKLSAGAAVATLVNDKVMSLSLYFSYAYHSDIQVGQTADVAVPSMSLTCKGTVAEIRQINMVSPEGGILFEAVITFANPGAMTEGMEATASLKAGDGSDIFPYDTGKLAYSQTEKLVTKLSGPVTTVNLLQYADVSQGQVLLTQGSDDLDDQIKDKQKDVQTAEDNLKEAQKGIPKARKDGEQALKDAQKGVRTAQRALDEAIQELENAPTKVTEAEKKLEEAQAALEGLNATAPISGSVTSCTILPGDELEKETQVITISNTAQMSVEIKVTEQNIGFITPGQMVELTDWDQNMWIGTVTNIDMNPSQDDMGSGATRYAVTLTVDNYDGSLSNGATLNYSFVTSQAENCLVVPNQALKSTMDEEGNEIMVVLVRAESRPDNAVTMPEQSPDRPKQYPSEEDGFYAVPVTTGMNDTYNVEIRSGLNEGDVVFVNYYSSSGWG